MSKNLLVVAVVVVVAVGAFFVLHNLGSSPDTSASPSLAEGLAIPEAAPIDPPPSITPPAQANPPQANPQPQPQPQPKINPPQSPPAAAPAPVKVIYTNSGFSPSVVTVKSGTTAVFQNQSDSPFWPASNPHPVHSGYPKGGGCAASAFDACKEVNPGSSWSFKFDIMGSWRYHDHLRPTNQGTIVVQ